MSRFGFLRKTRSLKTLRLLRFIIISHEIFRIKVELNFALNLLLRFLRKIQRPNSEFSPGYFRICWYHSKIFILAKLWPKIACMPIFGHAFFDHNSAIFGTIRPKLFKRAQETSVNRLVKNIAIESGQSAHQSGGSQARLACPISGDICPEDIVCSHLMNKNMLNYAKNFK